jgi:FAD/FMN-containing dehydrogenase
MEYTVLTTAVEQLAPQFHGQLLQSGDAGFDEARRVWNGMFDRQPALIARCHDVDDVVAAVNFARAGSLELAVRGGGHSAVGYGTCDGGMVIEAPP